VVRCVGADAEGYAEEGWETDTYWHGAFQRDIGFDDAILEIGAGEQG